MHLVFFFSSFALHVLYHPIANLFINGLNLFVILWSENMNESAIYRHLYSAGVISLLDESEEELKVYALQQLDAIVDQFWAEISDAIPKMFVTHHCIQ